MSIIADYLDYATARTWDQGNTIQCTAYSFFALLAEHVQQLHELEVEFDFDKYFKEMEKNRGTQMRVEYLCSHAKNHGYRTKCGKLVKIGSYRRFSAWRKWHWLCRHLQTVGPMIFAVKRYTGHKLNPKNLSVIEMPTEKQFKKKKMMGHAMLLRGYDNQSKWLKFQNSWKGGEDVNVKWMPWEVFQKINKYCYYIKDVTLN